MAQSCVSLAGTATCPAFDSASISTDSTLVGLFPFLADVTDTQTFDDQLQRYISGNYTQLKYQDLFGCQDVNLGNSTDLYARYTMSYICNGIIQNSIQPCGLSPQDSRPLCADSCADFALSEQRIVASPDLCGPSGRNAIDQLRADFTECALPPDSINGNLCVQGYQNEPNDCGFESNLQGLCAYCGGSTVNSTDSCCVASHVESRCQGVTLPSFSSMQPLFPSNTALSTAAPTSTSGSSPSSANAQGSGLTGGQIAGIVVGAVLGAALLLALLILFCVLLRRRKARRDQSSLNQPTPPHTGTAMAQTTQPRFEVLPGARVTRMTALEESSDPSSTDQTPDNRKHGYRSSPSDDWATSPESQGRLAAFGAVLPPKRGEKSSDESSPDKSSPEYSSPEAAAGQSEQMNSFKDYYSDDDIRPNDLVSTLWAYQPRANDEFELERGDMLRIVGIWDDGWATGVRVNQRAEDWEPGRSTLRDSGVSGASRQDDTPPANGEIKAFPLVCVCLPQHWRKTIEGESSSSEAPPGPDP